MSIKVASRINMIALSYRFLKISLWVFVNSFAPHLWVSVVTVFIEKNRAAAEVIKTNIKTLGLDGAVKVCLVSKYEDDQVYNLVFADPPYDKFDLEEVLHLVKFVGENGIFVLSHPGEAPELPGLRLWKSNQYAGATISIYQR